MKIKPIGERIVAKPIKVEEKTTGGIILTSTPNAVNTNIVEVIAVGLGEKISEEIKVGDKVIHSGYGVTPVKDGNEEFLIIGLENILGIID